MATWFKPLEPVNDWQRARWASFDSLPIGRIAADWIEAIDNVIVLNLMIATTFERFIPDAKLARAIFRFVPAFRRDGQRQKNLDESVAMAEAHTESDFELVNPQMLIAA